ncbi:hypothetical protein FACS1894181_18180 [Bacteroidia bacterium]|nr:hypothetical protein FACS1894181_18180 [Bacteroidia bacterium]
MSVTNTKIQSILEATFTSAIKELTVSEEGRSAVSDLYVQADAETGELQIYDEEENLLEKIVVFNWAHSEEETFDKKVNAALKPVFTLLTAKEVFNHPRILKPFSISLVDEDFSVIEELLFIDDDTFRLDDPLLKDLDADLDSFLKDILSDMPK